MICRSTRLGIGTGILVVVALAIAKPVFAGSWASSSTRNGHYGSCRSDIGCVTQPWGTSENVVPTVDTCHLYTLYGSCYTSGVVIRTLQYMPDGPDDPGPPDRVMIQETASVSAIAGGCDGSPNGSKGFTRNSLGPSTEQDKTTTIRKTWVDSSSGVITRKVYLAATAQVKQWSKAQVCVAFSGLSVLTGPYTGPVADRTAVEPPDHSSSQPYYPAPACSNPGVGGAAGHGDPVNLATGEHLYVPGADLSVYNPYGPAVSYQRNFFSKIAKEGKSSPGLPVGWLDGYDIRITSTNPADWSSLELTYPNSAKESPIAPVLAGGTPTGEFTEPAGSNHIVTGVPSATKGQWDSLTVTFKDRTKWRFSRTASDTYMLSAIVNRMGRSINIVRDAENRVRAVNDDQTNPVTLLSFTYPNGLLSQLTDVYGRKVRFTYEDVSGVTCLKTLSQISTSDAAPVAAEYGYELLGSPGEPHLTSVTIPSPKGSGNSTESFEYDSEVRVSALVDANGNRHEFSYECPDATRVKVKSPAGVVESEKLVIFDPAHDNVMTGTADADGANTARAYDDINQPDLPTKVTDRLGDTLEMTYDQYGNVLSVKNARGTITKYTYDYDEFALGRLTEVEQAQNLPADDPNKRPKTDINYYEPSGLVQSITYPAPGSTGPNGATVTASFVYDLADDPQAGTRGLGNILKASRPGNNAASQITTTYEYGPYDDVKLGQPVTVTVCDDDDPSPTKVKSVVHLEYDARGNVTSSTDALGNRVDYTFNVADQLLSTILPSTSQ